jgi:hypothetical protein
MSVLSGVNSTGAAIAATPIIKEGIDALRTSSFILMILGGIHYFLRYTATGYSELPLIFSLLLFLVAGYAVSARMQKDKIAILIPMLVFIIWYFVYKSNVSLDFLIYFIPISGFFFIIPMLFTKGESVESELYGCIPIVFLFMDVGLIPFLVERLGLPITDLVRNLVLFMPWWAFLGLMMLPSGENKGVNFFITAARVIGIAYILITILVPIIPDIGYDQNSLLPEIEEFERAQASFRAKIPQEHPFMSNIYCLGNIQDIAGCVKERQANSKLIYICKNIEKVKQGTEEFDDCLKEQKKVKNENLQAEFNPYVKKPTIFKFVEDKDLFQKDVYLGLTKPRFSLSLDYENPRENTIAAEFSCSFKKGNDYFKGEITNLKDSKLTISSDKGAETVTCEPPEGKLEKGTYSLGYQVKLQDLETSSTLTRYFIGLKTDDEKKKVIKSIEENKGVKVSKLGKSLSGKELVTLIFGMGNPAKFAIIESNTNNELIVSVQNIGTGQLLEIKSYEVLLEDFSAECLESKNPTKISSDKKFNRPLVIANCPLGDLPTKLKDVKDYVPKTFEAKLVYDYNITKEVKVEVHE